MPTAVRTRRRREGGFTIIEVAMASFIMAFGLATSIIVMQSGYMQVDLARGTTDCIARAPPAVLFWKLPYRQNP